MALRLGPAILLGAILAPLGAATLEVEARLLQATTTPEVADIAPYPRALCTYLYEVQKVHAGTYGGDRILVVKWAVWEKATLKGLPSEVGAVERLELDRWIDHPKLRSQRIVDTIRDTDLVIYYDPGSMPEGTGALTIGLEKELEGGVVKGELDGWLFLAEELMHAETGRFWEKDWRDVSRGGVDPLPAMLDFQRRLRTLGVKLLVVPVPTKVGIYPECLGSDVKVSALGEYVNLLRAAGLEVLDLEPIFTAGRKRATMHPLYCRQDSHWAPGACDVAAFEIRKYLGVPVVDPTLQVEIEKDRSVTIRGDLARMLDDPNYPPERIRHNRLRFTDGRASLGLSRPDSPVILLGDSHVTVFSEGTDEMHGAGCGTSRSPLPAAWLPGGCHRKSRRRSEPGASQPLSGDARSTRRIPATGSNKQWVVWVFAAREFTRAERWSAKIPVASPGPKRLDLSRGLQHAPLSLRLPAAGAGGLLSPATAGAERLAGGGELRVLRLGESALRVAAPLFDAVGFRVRARDGGRREGRKTTNPVAGIGRRQPRGARLLQVLRILRRVSAMTWWGCPGRSRSVGRAGSCCRSGISFYTFQSLSYTIDVYRRGARTDPALPRLRGLRGDVSAVGGGSRSCASPQICRCRCATAGRRRARFSRGIGFLVIGLAKKLLLANPADGWRTRPSARRNSMSLTAWIGMLAYCIPDLLRLQRLQRDGDRAGADAGIPLPVNFNAPYRSASISEFWRRWHITLGTWVRDYLYVPLGGSRKGRSRTMINLLIVMLLVGPLARGGLAVRGVGRARTACCW